jgi:hypothetical protein
VALFGPAVRVGITLDALPAPMPVVRRPLHVTELAARLGIQDVAELENSLDQVKLIERLNPMAEIPHSCGSGQGVPVIPLTELLAVMKSGASITRRLAVTAGEALWTGQNHELASLAIGLFIARMPDWSRRAVYGSAFSGPETTIYGDLPELEDLLWAAEVLDPSGQPTAFDLQERRVSGVLGSAAAALEPGSARLAVAGSPKRTTYGKGRACVTYVSAVAADPPSLPDPFHDKPFEPTSVGGADMDASLAEVKCFSEAAEFLISGAGLPANAVNASANDLDGPWLSPEHLVRYSDEHRARLGVDAFNADEAQWWVPGERAGERIWLPAALVVGRVPGQPSWYHPTAASSSGVAAHPVFHQAVRSAWLEAVERDAFQRCRLLAAAAPPASVRPSSIPATEREILRALSPHADVVILVLPSPTGCPVMLVRTDTDARVGLGCSAAHDPADALRHALIEAMGQAFSSVPPVDSPEQVRTPLDHAGLYSVARWRSRLDWMRSGPSIQFDDVPPAAVEDPPPSAAVYTFPMPIALPVHVVRVLDPELIPITFGYDSDPDGRPDFVALCRRAGRRPGAPLDPHPLA